TAPINNESYQQIKKWVCSLMNNHTHFSKVNDIVILCGFPLILVAYFLKKWYDELYEHGDHMECVLCQKGDS
ncbi:MAG: hypothetical protein KBT01_03040, partial [Clostridiales bacterium]|nr:hypothetical protein [Candidatus Blautia equi]